MKRICPFAHGSYCEENCGLNSIEHDCAFNDIADRLGNIQDLLQDLVDTMNIIAFKDASIRKEVRR